MRRNCRILVCFYDHRRKVHLAGRCVSINFVEKQVVASSKSVAVSVFVVLLEQLF